MVHADSQHSPLTQLPLEHALFAEQASPFGFLVTQLPAEQKYVLPAQSVSAEQTDLHEVAPHTYAPQALVVIEQTPAPLQVPAVLSMPAVQLALLQLVVVVG